MRLYELDMEKLEAEDSYVTDQDDLDDYDDSDENKVAQSVSTYGTEADAPMDVSELIGKIEYMQNMGLSASDKHYDPEKLMNIDDDEILQRIYDKVMGNVREGAKGAAIGGALGDIAGEFVGGPVGAAVGGAAGAAIR